MRVTNVRLVLVSKCSHATMYLMKKHGRSLTAFIILIGIPVYVLCVFVSEVFAPEMEVVQDDHTVARVTFVGDMMFDRYIRESGHARGYDSIFTDVLPMLGKSDVLVFIFLLV